MYGVYMYSIICNLLFIYLIYDVSEMQMHLV